MESEFEKELASLLKKYSLENGSNTPNFLLARYLQSCLVNYNETITDRDRWLFVVKKLNVR